MIALARSRHGPAWRRDRLTGRLSQSAGRVQTWPTNWSGEETARKANLKREFKS
jgi:hypothetical protein